MKLITTVLVVCVLALLALGIVMLYSIAAVGDSSRWVNRQLIAAGLGLVMATALAFSDHRFLKRASLWLLAGAVVMLVLVLVPGLGVRINGARRWFRFGGFQFQPSDFAKLALIVFIAHYGNHYQRVMASFRQGLVTPGLVVGGIMGLIFLEPDWGTALLLAAVSGVMFLVAGVRWYYLAAPVVLGGAAVAVLLWRDPVRFDRYYSWRHLEETKEAVGYQAWQARIALGSGGVTGKGLNQSTQKRLVPERQTDFIFAIIGEEFGFVGSLLVIAAFAVLVACGLGIAWGAPDAFGRLLATGITFLIGLQALLNIAVVSSAVPNKGIALPFISYGGSNLMMMLACAGLLVSVARAGQETTEATGEPLSLENVPVTRLA
jgi:cell division protein FtsW